jgi:hypothetical protein
MPSGLEEALPRQRKESHRMHKTPSQPAKTPPPKWRRGFVIVATTLTVGAVLVCCIGVGALVNSVNQESAAATQTAAGTPAPTKTATPTPATPTKTPSGAPALTFAAGDTLDSGPARSATFSVGTDASWQIQYACTTAAGFDSGFLIFDVHNGNGTDADMSGPLGPTSCPKGTTNGSVTVTETPNGVAQSRYLEVTAHGATWTLTVIA